MFEKNHCIFFINRYTVYCYINVSVVKKGNGFYYGKGKAVVC